MPIFSSALLASKEVAANAQVATVEAATKQEAVLPLAGSQEQLIQVTLSLLLVLAVIYAVAWIIKRNRGVQGLSGLPMKTLAVLPMGVKEKIVLIEVGGKQILLGMTAHNINALASFDEPILVAKDKTTTGFAERLKQIMSQVKQDNQAAPPPPEDKTTAQKPSESAP
ncbi:MAG: flagellar biosynthetic protein FliO [Bermanella sp.]